VTFIRNKKQTYEQNIALIDRTAEPGLGRAGQRLHWKESYSRYFNM